MVARSGQGWTLAPSLATLVDQVDAEFPDRPTLADGSIGDARHQAESSSDHNPRLAADGEWYVTAVDITADEFSPDLAALLAQDDRVKYLIWRGRYLQRVPWSRTDPVDVWVPYNGANRHDGHIHVSVQMGGINDTRPWALPEDDMSATAEAAIDRIEALLNRVHRVTLANVQGKEDRILSALADITAKLTELIEKGTPDAGD